MIVTETQDGYEVVTQIDHAGFSAQLAGLWRTDGLPAHPRREELLFAIREHDNGWAEIDSAPRAEPTSGRPVDFLSLPDDERLDVWERGVERHAEEHPWAAALIGRHAVAIHADRTAEPWRALEERILERRAGLLERAGGDEAELEEDYRWVDLFDALSLVVCNRWSREVDGRSRGVEVAAHFDGERLRLDPLPLAGSTTFSLPVRYVPKRPYASDGDLAVELASAIWSRRQVVVA